MKHGFTLLEVLVALTIFAVTAAGLMAAAGQSARQLEALETRTFAQWIAANRMTELHAARTWPQPGVSDGKVSYAGREWELRTTISETPRADMRKVVVGVRAGRDDAASLTGFLGRY